jgi:hypothetical protein
MEREALSGKPFVLFPETSKEDTRKRKVGLLHSSSNQVRSIRKATHQSQLKITGRPNDNSRLIKVAKKLTEKSNKNSADVGSVNEKGKRRSDDGDDINSDISESDTSDSATNIHNNNNQEHGHKHSSILRSKHFI